MGALVRTNRPQQGHVCFIGITIPFDTAPRFFGCRFPPNAFFALSPVVGAPIRRSSGPARPRKGKAVSKEFVILVEGAWSVHASRVGHASSLSRGTWESTVHVALEDRDRSKLLTVSDAFRWAAQHTLSSGANLWTHITERSSQALSPLLASAFLSSFERGYDFRADHTDTRIDPGHVDTRESV